MSFKAAFLDRDGVLNEDLGYVFKLSDLKLLPTAKESLELLKEKNFKLIVVTNQSGVARGMFTEDDVVLFNEELNRQVGNIIDAFYICPFHPDAVRPQYRLDSDYRKPGTGMLEQAMVEHDLDKDGSFMVGDKSSDVTCGLSFGLQTFQMESRYESHPNVSKRYKHLKDIVVSILS